MNKHFRYLVGAITILAVSGAHADPPVPTKPLFDPIPPVFCMRIMDIERVIIDGTPGNDFVFDFEVLNWTGTAAGGLYMAKNIGTTKVLGAAPIIFGAGIDRDGRGGGTDDVGGFDGPDIDASGGGLTVGSGNFDGDGINLDGPTAAAHSGRGRGDLAGALNDWTPSAMTPTTAAWSVGAGTVIPFQDLISVSTPGGVLPSALVPTPDPDALPPPFGPDSGIDGGPGTTVVEEDGVTAIPDGDFNVLDGFTLTIQDWDINELLSLNWFLLDAAGIPIGTAGAGGGNGFGFGVLNLARVAPGAALPGGVFQGNTGFNQFPATFFDSVSFIPNPAEFGAELGAAITGGFVNSQDNIFAANINAQLIPNPGTLLLLGLGLPLIARICRKADI